jgi:lipopolysaccharide assembly protein A
MRILTWLIRAFLFFALFAFALNNQHDTVVHWFFGAQWRAPLVIVVLTAFAAGLALGVLAMVPRWWRHRRLAQRQARTPPAAMPAAAEPTTTAAPSDLALAQPPREGL